MRHCSPPLKDTQQQILNNAQALAQALIEHGFDIVSGGTDNHLMLVDLRKKGITGKKAEKLLEGVGITCNKNAIPFDPEKPFVTSGIRLGTPAVTTRGMKEEDMRLIADVIDRTLIAPEETHEDCSKAIQDLLAKYPLYE